MGTHKLKLRHVNPAIHGSGRDGYRQDWPVSYRSRNVRSCTTHLDAGIEVSKRAIAVSVMVEGGGLVDALVSRHRDNAPKKGMGSVSLEQAGYSLPSLYLHSLTAI